jgi:hypothetical protein
MKNTQLIVTLFFLFMHSSVPCASCMKSEFSEEHTLC